MCNRNTSVLRHALTAAVALAVCGANSFAFGDEAAQIGREGQAFGKQLSNEFSFPTESGGSFNLGNGTTIGPSDLAPSGDGLYVQDPDVQGMQGVYDSDHDMDVTGRAAQGKLYSDAQAKGNPFDPDPAKRDIPGPSTVSGAAYQVILGLSDARNEFPDLSNDPIISGSGSAMLDDSLLESFGDCKVETQVTESTRPVRVPEEEFCERVIKPAASSCQVKHELVVEEVDGSIELHDTATAKAAQPRCNPGQGIMDRALPRNFTLIFPNTEACAGRSNGPLQGVSVSMSGLAVTAWNGADLGFKCEGVKSFTGGNTIVDDAYRFGVTRVANKGIFCENERVIAKIEHVDGIDHYQSGAATFFSLTMTISGTIEGKKLIVSTDRWYPEECVARAQRG